MSRPLACAAAVAVLLLAGCGTRGGPGPAPGDGARARPPVAGRVTGRPPGPRSRTMRLSDRGPAFQDDTETLSDDIP